MDITYQKWLSLKVTHNYFTKANCPVLLLVPFDSSKTLMNNYQILFERTEQETAFYLGMKTSGTNTVKEELQGADKLYFQVISTDNYFFNYTNINSLNEGTGFYFSNGRNTQHPDWLQQEEFVSSVDVFNLKPLSFSISLPATETIVTIKNMQGKVLFEKTIAGKLVPEYFVDLRGEGDGVYQLWLNNQLNESFFATSQHLDEKSIGVLEINIETLTEQMNMGSVPVLALSFEARSTYWQYGVIVKENHKIEVEGIHIADEKGIPYNGPEQGTIVGGQVAQWFTSLVPVVLREKLSTNPLLKLSYYNDFSERLIVMEVKMPNPKVSELIVKMNEKNEPSYFSPNIIYV